VKHRLRTPQRRHLTFQSGQGRFLYHCSIPYQHARQDQGLDECVAVRTGTRATTFHPGPWAIAAVAGPVFPPTIVARSSRQWRSVQPNLPSTTAMATTLSRAASTGPRIASTRACHPDPVGASPARLEPDDLDHSSTERGELSLGPLSSPRGFACRCRCRGSPSAGPDRTPRSRNLRVRGRGRSLVASKPAT